MMCSLCNDPKDTRCMKLSVVLGVVQVEVALYAYSHLASDKKPDKVHMV